MVKVQSFFQLRTWKESHELVLEIYKTTQDFPSEERFGVTSQLRRASVSIPANIAEGMGRQSTKDFVRFLINARGSTQEVVYFLRLSRDLNYILVDLHDELVKRYSGLNAGINSHINSLNRK